MKDTERWCARHNDWNCSSSGSEVELVDPNAKTCRGTTRVANYRTEDKTEENIRTQSAWSGEDGTYAYKNTMQAQCVYLTS